MTPLETTRVDVIVIGAGPAGMAAAATAAAHGARVLLLDEQPQAGGQIYRDVERVAPLRGALLGPDYLHGRGLAADLRAEGIQHVRGAAVWMVEPGFRVTYSCGQRSALAEAKQLILATGALERPMPLPGWTLPGVMTAGAAQILLKASGVLTQRAVLVGSGPLLYLVASQLCVAGAPPLALLETQTPRDFRQALAHLGGALRGWRYLLKGAAMLQRLRRAGVRRYTAVNDVHIEGEGTVQAVRFQAQGQSQRIACETVLLHHGVVPHTQIARAMDIEHRWDEVGQCFVPQRDAWGETAQAGVFIAGDSAGIGGARVAECEGRLAALRALQHLGKLSEAQVAPLAQAVRREREGHAAVRPFLDAAYPPFAQALRPSDDTVVCRCEEVTAGDIRGYAKLGCLGPNQAKAFGRCGMGPCQGRMCGLSVSRLLADAHGMQPDAVGYQRIRSPLKPVTLAELASMHDADAAQPANAGH